jgi:hypothetical protein
MKLPAFLNKPRWQSKDAAKRRSAIAHDNDRELLANLGRLAREDTDADVRIAAAKRLADPGIAQGLARDDADPGVRAQARALWLDLLTGTHPAAPTVVERLRLLRAQEDPELAERIACNATEPELRRAALEHITRPALLLERAIEDRDATIRLALVERFSDEAMLERLAERARKSDKQVARRARERIEALRIGRGDSVTLEQRARLLCERLEQLLRVPSHTDAEQDIVAQWSAIEPNVTESLRARFRTARALLATSRDPVPRVPLQTAPAIESVIQGDLPQDTPDIATEAPADIAHEAIAVDETVESGVVAPDALIAPLMAQARFAVSLDEAQAARKQRAEQQRVLQNELDDALRACEAALEAGASAQAHAAKTRIDDLRRRIDAPLSRATQLQLAAVDARHAELSHWQHWADNQRRQQLCEEIEALPELRLHPDAVATKVRDAQTEWTRLDAVEGGGVRGGDLNRRFHAACRAALAPAQTYFKKRHELRQSQATGVNALLERVGALGEDNSDWAAVSTLRRETIEALRGLDRVEPRERKALAQSLKASLTSLDARVERRDAEVERGKAALIVEAEALAENLPRGAVASARDLQQRWQRAGNGRRSRDQAQWNTFRAAVDRVFGKLDAERAERSARDNEGRTQAESICLELETLAAAQAPAERGAIMRLQSAWDALRPRDADLLRRYGEVQIRLREFSQQQERVRRHARFHAWLDRYRVCRAAETSSATIDALLEQWQHAPQGDIATDELAGRFAAATTADAQPNEFDADDDAFRDVLVELELLAGVESPDADRERRRTRQISRLSSRMSGGAASNPSDEVAALLVRWSELGATSDGTFDRRVERALLAALDSLP